MSLHNGQTYIIQLNYLCLLHGSGATVVCWRSVQLPSSGDGGFPLCGEWWLSRCAVGWTVAEQAPLGSEGPTSWLQEGKRKRESLLSAISFVGSPVNTRLSPASSLRWVRRCGTWFHACLHPLVRLPDCNVEELEFDAAWLNLRELFGLGGHMRAIRVHLVIYKLI